MAVTPKAEGRHRHGVLPRVLIDAVAEIVRDAGPDAVSLRECARRAGVSHSAAAPPFGDKRGLLTAFVIEGEALLAATLRQEVAALPADADADAPARLAATGRGSMRFARAHPAYFRLMFRTDRIDHGGTARPAAADDAFAVLDQAMAEDVLALLVAACAREGAAALRQPRPVCARA